MGAVIGVSDQMLCLVSFMPGSHDLAGSQTAPNQDSRRCAPSAINKKVFYATLEHHKFICVIEKKNNINVLGSMFSR